MLSRTDRLVLVSYRPYEPFHTQPIKLVVYEWPLGGLRPGRSHLEAGFPLRCFQRLSQPDIATRHCRWRDNRHTRGPSFTVLSY